MIFGQIFFVSLVDACKLVSSCDMHDCASSAMRCETVFEWICVIGLNVRAMHN